MKLLFLGGTQFVGRHMVDAALKNGHEVSLFNRGNTNSELFPNAEKLRGNRDGDLNSLKGRRWDAVIDVNGYVPRLVRDSATLLADAVERYVFISTVGVYADMTAPDQDETASLARMDDETVEKVTGETYRPLKVLCEKAVETALPGRTLIIRPGYVVGPFDHTDRFNYWLRRYQQGGEMLAPGTPMMPTQHVDGRDLGGWTIAITEKQAAGVYNATGPDYPLTWGKVFDACENVTRAGTTLTWVGEDFLSEKEVGGAELPMWEPAAYMGGSMFNISKAISAGLTFRPLADTIRDTLEWDKAEGKPKAGLKPERETELLAAWRERK